MTLLESIALKYRDKIQVHESLFPCNLRCVLEQRHYKRELWLVSFQSWIYVFHRLKKYLIYDFLIWSNWETLPRTIPQNVLYIYALCSRAPGYDLRSEIQISN